MAVEPAEVEAKRAKRQLLEAQYLKGHREERWSPRMFKKSGPRPTHTVLAQAVIHHGKSDKGPSQMPTARSSRSPFAL